MSKPKKDNVLYRHLKKSINNALPLEYAIRAVSQVAPEKMAQLREINEELTAEWLERGVTEDELHAEELLDFSWDILQVGFPLSRFHGRVLIDEDFAELIRSTLNQIAEKYVHQVRKLEVPLGNRFRYCDLLNGNPIDQLLEAITKCLDATQRYKTDDSVPLKEFVLCIREPILLYPGASFGFTNGDNPGLSAFALSLRFDMEYEDIKLAVEEFLYQYAKYRESREGQISVSVTTRKLINDFLRKDILEKLRKGDIARHDGFISVLSGLYCWDRYMLYKVNKQMGAMETAVKDTVEILNRLGLSKDNYDEAVKKNYKTVKRKIERLIVEHHGTASASFM